MDEEAAKKNTSSTIIELRYWHPTLLEQWRRMYPSSTTDNANNNSSDVDHLNLLSSDINYGSYILLSTFLAELLCTRLSLGVVNTAATTTLLSFETTTVCNGHDNNDDDTNDGSGGGGTSNVRKVGISIPEGPFLPLFILTIHSLNIAISELAASPSHLSFVREIMRDVRGAGQSQAHFPSKCH